MPERIVTFGTGVSIDGKFWVPGEAELLGEGDAVGGPPVGDNGENSRLVGLRIGIVDDRGELGCRFKASGTFFRSAPPWEESLLRRALQSVAALTCSISLVKFLRRIVSQE